MRVLDMGTGSGALAITLALELDEADVTALDRSREALWVAMANAARLGASVSFVQSDWFSALGDERFDLIVANPPYIAAADPHLEQGDVRFEPPGALAAGPSGLDDLEEIVMRAPSRLENDGWLFLEHGYDQAAAVRGLLADAGFAAIASWKDIAGIERVSGGRWLGRD
jgi:release factor glutamine methyltransferase